MIRVICIDGKPKNLMAFTLPEGVVLNAWQSPIYSQSYIIEGHDKGRDGIRMHHKKHRFIPLSSIDELELQSKREGELVKLYNDQNNKGNESSYNRILEDGC